MAKNKTEEFGRDCVIRARQTKVTNLNVKPEKAGTELMERADLSIEFLLRTEEMPQILDVKGGADALWDDNGEPIIEQLDGDIALKLVIVGTAKIGHKNGAMTEFKTAKLKKIRVEPMLETQITVRAQLRVDPEDDLGLLSKLVLERACKFAFNGKVLEKSDDEDDGEEGDDNQGKLPV